jgi:hypothetical protein
VQEDDLEMIEGFYNQQLEMAHKRLYELIQQLIQLVRQISPPTFGCSPSTRADVVWCALCDVCRI